MGALCENPAIKVRTEKFDPFYLSTIASIISMKDVLPSGLPVKAVHSIQRQIELFILPFVLIQTAASDDAQ